eukprot:275567-Pelagomonas_calceolata.AAC.1
MEVVVMVCIPGQLHDVRENRGARENVCAHGHVKGMYKAKCLILRTKSSKVWAMPPCSWELRASVMMLGDVRTESKRYQELLIFLMAKA